MKIDETIDEAAVLLDEVLAQNISDLERLLLWHGATDEELARELEIAEQTRLAERARVLATLRGWLERDCQSLQ